MERTEGALQIGHLIVCPQCGRVIAEEDLFGKDVCDVCGHEWLILDEYYCDNWIKLGSRIKGDLYLRNKYGLVFDMKYVAMRCAFEKKISDAEWAEVFAEGKERKAKQQAEDKANGVVRCPKCGSTAVTAVQRKWSPVTGFMTNKVDRVCMHCKHKW